MSFLNNSIFNKSKFFKYATQKQSLSVQKKYVRYYILEQPTKTSAKVCRVEAWTFVCHETSSSLTKGLIILIRSSDHMPSVD